MSPLSAMLRAKQPLVMGVLNATPDSFSDGGEAFTPEAGVAKAESLRKFGADILDIGGEATGPRSEPITAQEELRRLLPVLKAVAPSHLVSVDTYKAAVARKALEAGAAIINDVSALRADPEMPAVLREHKDACIVLMHSKEAADRPHATNSAPPYGDVIRAVGDFLAERIDFALAGGISAGRLILDPGMGQFVSSEASVSWELLLRLSELAERFADFPILIATSRKGFLGGRLAARDPLSQLSSLWASEHGAHIIRTHNPAQMQELLSLWRTVTR